MSDHETSARDALELLEEMISNTPIADVARMIMNERDAAQKVENVASERLAALDRALAKHDALRGDMRTVEAERNIFKRERDRLQGQAEAAQSAASELRGRLKEARANQLVRRGDIIDPGMPNPYDDGVPF